MSGPQFTPAPWRLEKQAKFGGTHMYWVNDFTTVGTQIPGDANLIAAAPELYLALENILSWTDEDATQAAAREALAKARGEAA